MKLFDKLYGIYFFNVKKWWNPHARWSVSSSPKFLSSRQEAVKTGIALQNYYKQLVQEHPDSKHYREMRLITERIEIVEYSVVETKREQL